MAITPVEASEHVDWPEFAVADDIAQTLDDIEERIDRAVARGAAETGEDEEGRTVLSVPLAADDDLREWYAGLPEWGQTLLRDTLARRYVAAGWEKAEIDWEEDVIQLHFPRPELE